jgi:hypothetical protein
LSGSGDKTKNFFKIFQIFFVIRKKNSIGYFVGFFNRVKNRGDSYKSIVGYDSGNEKLLCGYLCFFGIFLAYFNKQGKFSDKNDYSE